MTDLRRRRLVAGSMTVAALVFLGLLWWWRVGLDRPASRSTGPTVGTTGPSITQLQRLGELAPVRIQVTDVLAAEGEGYRGVWLIKGDALLTCDVSQGRILRQDPVARSAVLRLPPLRVTSARVDHTKTKTWSVEKTSWLPWNAGNRGQFSDAAMFHAQQLIESAAAEESNLAVARTQTEELVRQMYSLVDWQVSVEWEAGP